MAEKRLPPRIPFALRDLSATIHAPALLAGDIVPPLDALPETAALLQRLEADPAPLTDALRKARPRTLGRYFETLLLFWLDELDGVEMIARNFPVRNGGRTIGEIDALFRYRDTLYHWELAAKFYLNIASGGQARHFIGPGLRDRLDLKLGRLTGLQLRLLEREEARAALSLAAMPLQVVPFVKGWLFDPLAPFSAAATRPPEISRSAARGLWCPLSSLYEDAPLPPFSHFRLLEKPRWITPFFYPEEATEGGISMLKRAASTVLATSQMPLLIALLQDGGRAELDFVTQLFITPGDWLSRAREAHLDEKFGD